jgi:protein-tyrosine phosphatase
MDPNMGEFAITDEQAAELVRLLQHALDNSMNVLVHCFAGICRSGAVVEVGTLLGFTATEKYRQPNLRVKHKMMRKLGMYYDENEISEMKGGSND